jgi:hypothetical protein
VPLNRMKGCATSRRVAGVAAAVTVALGWGLRWLSRRRPAPVAVVRCPIHGIAYDAELEVCPDCAKVDGATGSGTLPTAEKGGVR